MGRSSGKKLKNLQNTRGAVFNSTITMNPKPLVENLNLISKIEYAKIFNQLKKEALTRGSISPTPLKLQFDKSISGVNFFALNLDHSQFGPYVLLDSASGNTEKPELAGSFKNVTFNSTQIQESLFIGSNFSGSRFLSTKIFSSDFKNCDFENTEFAASDNHPGLEDLIFEDSNFENSNFKGAFFDPESQFLAVSFSNCDFDSDMSFEGIDFSRSVFYNISLERPSFEKAKIDRVTFENCDIDAPDFSDASLSRARFISYFPGSTKSIISNAYFSQADLTGASFHKVHLEHPMFYSNTKIDQIKTDESEISHSNLAAVTIKDSVFNDTRFYEVNFKDTDFEKTRFVDCQFEDCGFPKSWPSGVSFKNCDGVDP